MVDGRHDTTESGVLHEDGESPDGSGLKVLLAVCVVAAILAVIAVIWQLAGNLVGDRIVDVSIDAADLTIAEAGEGFEPTEVIGTVAASSAAYLVVSIGNALAAAAAAVMAIMIGLAVNSARLGDPFVAENSRRLRIAAIAAVPGFAGAMVASFGVMMATEGAGFIPQTTVSFAWIFVFVILAVLSEVWKVGVRLREDFRLTV